jgi:hypothetical protein
MELWTKFGITLIGAMLGGWFIAWINGYYSKRGERAAIRELLPEILTQARLTAYEEESGKRQAINEDLQNVIKQLSETTNTIKKIEDGFSIDSWRREKRWELQIEAIKTVNLLLAEFYNKLLDDKAAFKPSNEWFISFSATNSLINALFNEEIYKLFKNVEKMIGPPNEINRGVESLFPKAHDTAIKAMVEYVLGQRI